MQKKYRKNFFLTGILIALNLLWFATPTMAQEKQYNVGCIAFYNLENLFDTIDSPNTNDAEFTPTGSSAWTSQRYNEKLINMATVISQIGGEYIKGGPSIIGFSEIENREVLEDLINTPLLRNSGYDIVHYNSPDRRGVDVGLIYRTKSFKVTNSRSATLKIEGDEDFKTRDILVVSGLFDGDMIHILVNHWPSRRGGEKASAPLRNAAGQLARNIVDSILTTDANAKIIVMGDLNDDPINESVVKYLKAKGKLEKLNQGEMYNPMDAYYKKGIGTTAYQDVWSLFDQLIISQGLLGDDKTTYKYLRAEIFKKDFMLQKEGRFAGYPLRTFAGGAYMGGYSDHFPVYLFLIKEK